MLPKCTMFAALIMLLAAANAPARTWTSATGALQIEAELIEKLADGTVVLKRADGVTIETKPEKFSKADQEYIRQWTPAADPAKEGPAKQDETPKKEDVPEKSDSALSPDEAAAVGKIKSAQVKAAVQSYEELEKKLSAAQAAKQKQYCEKLAGMLEDALKEATAADNLDDALAIRNAVQALKSGREPPLPGMAATDTVKGRGGADKKDEQRPVFFVSYNFPSRMIGDDMRLTTEKDKGAFIIRPGLSGAGTISLESVRIPGSYLAVPKVVARQGANNLTLDTVGDDANQKRRASFKKRPGVADRNCVSLESASMPGLFIRHREFVFLVTLLGDTAEDRQCATFRLMDAPPN